MVYMTCSSYKKTGERVPDETLARVGTATPARRSSKSRNGLRESSRSVSPGLVSRYQSPGRKRRSRSRTPTEPMFNRFMHAPRDPSTPRRGSHDWGSDYTPSPNSPKVKARTLVYTTIPQPRIERPVSLQAARPVTASKAKKRTRGRKSTRFRALFSILALSYGAWYRQVRKDIGFCTPITPSTTPMDGTGTTLLTSEQYVRNAGLA